MYEMLSGVKPFSAPDVSSILRNVVERVPPMASEVNKDVPEPIALFVAHLFAKAPEDRFGTAMEALGELHALRQGTPAGAPSEVLTPESGVASVAPGSRSSKVRDATTDRVFDDARPAASKTNVLPTRIALGIVGTLAAALLTTIAIIRIQTDPTPTGVITPQQHAEVVLRKQSLATAQALLDAGRYDDSIRAFDTYARMHPESVVAKEGRANAMKAADAAKSGSTVTTQASKSKKKTAPDKKQPGSLWQRIFRRGKTTSKP
jgi:serine/threonine protein kinase